MRHELLDWFDRHRRDLPWRRTGDPYGIWLSEVMLQQTQVERVIPFYQRFLARFPTVDDLAAADLPEVLALWSGLGYYRRARQLHRAARAIVERGGFPSTLEGLLELPGIGPYTAAAVGSIAFGIPVPVLDGNVERVLSRLLALSESPKSTAGRRRLLAAAGDLLDAARPGDCNQAMMELGATVCTPRRPSCLLCPLRPACRAAARGEQELYPTPRPRRAAERHRLVMAVVESGGKVLLFRRPDHSELLAGTWELPWVGGPVDGHRETAETAPAEEELAGRYGGRWRLGARLGRVGHGITYRDIEVEVHRGAVEWGGSVAEGPEAGWFDAEERQRLPLSSLVEKVLALAAR